MRRILYRWLSPKLTRSQSIARRIKALEMALDLVLTKLFPNTSIPFLESSRGTGSMEHDWDNRARLNPLITATGEADEEKAEASALRGLEARILTGIHLGNASVVLEIGCGIGNLLKPLSKRVKEAHGVDISGEMLRLAAQRLKGCSNIFLHKTDGRLGMFPDRYFDFIFSSGVFIHFPHKSLVYQYFEEASRVLKPGGVFRFQVDGRSYLRWRFHKGGTLRGVVFTQEEIKENLGKYDLQVQEITGVGSPDMWTAAVGGVGARHRRV